MNCKVRIVKYIIGIFFRILMAPVIIIMISIRTRALSLVQQEKNGINKIIVILITNVFFLLAIFRDRK